MPRIELYQDQLGTSTPQPNRGAANVSGLTAGTDAIGQLAQIGAGIAGQVIKNERALKVSSVTTQAAMELEGYVFDITKTDRDYATQYERYTDFATDLTERYSKQFEGDQAGLSVFRQEIGQLAFKKGFDVRSNAITGQMDQQKGQLTLNLAALAELAVQGDAEQREVVETKAKLLLQESYNNGVVDAEEAVAMGLKMQDDLVSGQVRYDILQDPDATVDKLLKGDYSGMSNERQMIWLEKANSASEARLRKQITEEDRSRREQERLEKQAAEDMAKTGDELLYSGELTTDWLEQNRDILDESDYRFYYKALSTGSEASTNVQMYSDLRTRASQGQDVRDEARAALRRGQLKVADYDKLINRSEQNIGITSAPNWFEQGEQFFGRAFRQSDVNFDPAQAQRLANVLDDWTTYAQEHPNATRDEAMRFRDQLFTDYQFLDASRMTIAKRKPRFAVGDRQNMDIDATMRATLEAMEAGELSEDEFNRQAILIKEWEDAMRAMNRTGANNATDR